MDKELLVPIKLSVIDLFKNKGLDKILSAVKDKVDAFESDVTTDEGRKEIASFSYKIARTKTTLDDMGKELVSKQKEELKLVDAERKRARDFLDAEKIRARKPLTDYEEAEATTMEARRLQELFNLDYEEALSMDDLLTREREVKRKEAEFERIAEEQRQKEESARLEKERIEREKRIKDEAAREAARKFERERLESLKREQDAKEALEQAERDKIEAARQAEIDKQAAVELAKRQAEERARIEKLDADRKAAELKTKTDKKAANKRHQECVNLKAFDGLIEIGIKTEDARKIITAIAQGKIPGVTINY